MGNNVIKPPDSLLEAIRRGKVIPFVGAGLSAGVRGKNGARLFPAWAEILRLAADRLDKEGKGADAQLVRANLGKDRLVDAANSASSGLGKSMWIKFLKENYDRTYDEAQPDSLAVLFQVWELGSSLVITTNYDRSLQWACPDRYDFRVWDIDAKAEQLGVIRDGGLSKSTVWHLHGQIDNAAGLVMTEADYKKLYSIESGERKAAVETLRSLLRSHTFLFLGFSMSDATFLRQVVSTNEQYDGAANQHYALLKGRPENGPDLTGSGIEAIYYDDHDQIPEFLSALGSRDSLFSHQNFPMSRFLVNQSEGLYFFNGRGDAYFKFYDDALKSIQETLDIFSLKLSRFRKQHEGTLLQAASRVKIRIALLDPRFPLTEEKGNLASIREREEKSQTGAIRRDVAEWVDTFNRYRKLVLDGTIIETEHTGLEIRLYNVLPTVNLFSVDQNLFVGPYLLNVEDRETPTFMIRSEAPQKGSVGDLMSGVYKRHFDAVWSSPETRSLSTVEQHEVKAWRTGRSYEDM